MSTFRQKKLARNIVDNLEREKPLNKKELLISSGYSKISATASSSELISLEGVKDELTILGFDVDSAKRIVSQIMLDPMNDPNARLKATDQVFKVQGAYAPIKSSSVNLELKITDPKVKELSQKFSDELKEKLFGGSN